MAVLLVFAYRETGWATIAALAMMAVGMEVLGVCLANLTDMVEEMFELTREEGESRRDR